jgi:hypothetical protein
MIASPVWVPVLDASQATSEGHRTQPNGIGKKCANAQEQAPRRRDLQSTLLFFGSFGKDPIRHSKLPRKG